jgi:hypothetical protein|tara:strand:+ start:147 stop:383 length:237 start_codon:yes stop_codon:yes gene_type:complete
MSDLTAVALNPIKDIRTVIRFIRGMFSTTRSNTLAAIVRKRARDNYRYKKSGGGYKKTRRVGKINKLKKGGFRKTRNK